MEIVQQDYHNLPFSRLFCDFIDDKPEIISFFGTQHNYRQLRDKVSTYQFPGDRQAAAQVIRKFNRSFSLDPAARENLGLLDDEQTVTITTGQQVSLFGGPLYTVYKTLTTIHLARLLSRDTGRNVVPVFWLADEDHDFEEVANVKLPDHQSLRVIQHPCESCSRHATGKIIIDTAFEAFRTEVFDCLTESDFHNELVRLLNECYSPGRTFRHAFGELLARLFSRHGLILAGSNFREAKVFTKNKIRQAIENAEEIRDRLTVQSDTLARSYHQQALVLDSLLFWHDKDAGRVRLVRENGTWTRDPGTVLTTKELLEELESNPESFSPNVFLRPVLQDTLLPNAAYIGGPAEIAYYGQMKQLYDFFEQPMPFLTGRLSATLVEPSVARYMQELPYGFSDYSKRLEDLEQHYLRKFGDPDLDRNFDLWKQGIVRLSEQMAETIGISDPGLHKHSQAITKEYQNAVDKLKRKMVHAVRTREEVQINRIRKVKNALFPCDRLQEREISFIHFMNKYGLDIWDRILENLDNGEGRVFNRHHVINL